MVFTCRETKSGDEKFSCKVNSLSLNSVAFHDNPWSSFPNWLHPSIERFRWVSLRRLKNGGIAMISENVMIAVPVAEIFLKDAVKFLLDLGWMIVELD